MNTICCEAWVIPVSQSTTARTSFCVSTISTIQFPNASESYEITAPAFYITRNQLLDLPQIRKPEKVSPSHTSPLPRRSLSLLQWALNLLQNHTNQNRSSQISAKRTIHQQRPPPPSSSPHKYTSSRSYLAHNIDPISILAQRVTIQSRFPSYNFRRKDYHILVRRWCASCYFSRPFLNAPHEPELPSPTLRQ